MFQFGDVIALEVDIFFLLYMGAGFLLLFGLWIYTDHKDKQRIITRQSKVIYHCVKCSQIYTGPYAGEECDCPHCGFSNGRLRF